MSHACCSLHFIESVYTYQHVAHILYRVATSNCTRVLEGAVGSPHTLRVVCILYIFVYLSELAVAGVAPHLGLCVHV